jgi:cytidyltransferase-like protein
MRTAIFGGTFDPIHSAHLEMARRAADQYQLDRVLFVPSGNPPHKHAEASFENRYRMVELACAADPRFVASPLEEGAAKSYSIDTIERVKTSDAAAANAGVPNATAASTSALNAPVPRTDAGNAGGPNTAAARSEAAIAGGPKAATPPTDAVSTAVPSAPAPSTDADGTLFFIIGSDAFAEIKTWRRWEDVIRAVDFIVAARPGHEIAGPPGARVHRLDSAELPVSSSDIRDALARGETPEELPPGVAGYIRDHRLYGSV